ncbi:MAG: GNAT family N-acetyltransferase [Bacteroidales bacterium]|nr:GNAT family N-acetyltransferase [Bacteroidales bacterium]
MNILLDTNIIIPLEDTNKILDSSFAEARKLSSEQRHCLFVHPKQVDDINRDKNTERKKILLSRIKQYSTIENPPILTEEDCLNLGISQKNDHDKVDNNLLFALYRGAVHLLVTNDEGVHRKAKLLSIQDKVYRFEQWLTLLKNYSSATSQTYSGVKECFLYEIDKMQPFFDSLRQTYDQFDIWFQKCAEEQRKCWCIEDDKGLLAAICIYKREKDEKLTDDGNVTLGNILKLCTFKVDSQARGKKLGERLMYIAFNYCVKNNIDWVYLHTVGEEQKMLVGLCEDYGFSFLGKYKGDDVYLKPMKFQVDDLKSIDSMIRYYPHYNDDTDVQKFIVPIQSQFHEDLFPDFSELKGSLFEHDQTLFSSQGNTIKKAYLSHSKIRSIQAGDVVLFYRSHDRKSIQCIGIVEKVFFSKDLDEVFPSIAKRTVYAYPDLQKILQQKTLVILFRYIALEQEIPREKIAEAGIKGNIQSIRQISHEQYMNLIK